MLSSPDTRRHEEVLPVRSSSSYLPGHGPGVGMSEPPPPLAPTPGASNTGDPTIEDADEMAMYHVYARRSVAEPTQKYDHEERAAARELAQQLARNGWHTWIWFHKHQIPESGLPNVRALPRPR